jgi:hypothetical protein
MWDETVPTTGIVDLDVFKISTRVPVKPEFQNLLEMEMDAAEGAERGNSRIMQCNACWKCDVMSWLQSISNPNAFVNVTVIFTVSARAH